jgi:hypothetical protein
MKSSLVSLPLREGVLILLKSGSPIALPHPAVEK